MQLPKLGARLPPKQSPMSLEPWTRQQPTSHHSIQQISFLRTFIGGHPLQAFVDAECYCLPTAAGPSRTGARASLFLGGLPPSADRSSEWFLALSFVPSSPIALVAGNECSLTVTVVSIVVSNVMIAEFFISPTSSSQYSKSRRQGKSSERSTM
ncbi:hypothetical protein BKA80DRAFT_263284, partial [Phyllosticta citrichinensis]